MDQRKHKHSDQQVFWWRTRGSSPTEGGRRQRPGWQRKTGLQGCLNPEGNLAHSQGLWWAKRVKESKGEWPCPEERGLPDESCCPTEDKVSQPGSQRPAHRPQLCPDGVRPREWPQRTAGTAPHLEDEASDASLPCVAETSVGGGHRPHARERFRVYLGELGPQFRLGRKRLRRRWRLWGTQEHRVALKAAESGLEGCKHGRAPGFRAQWPWETSHLKPPLLRVPPEKQSHRGQGQRLQAGQTAVTGAQGPWARAAHGEKHQVQGNSAPAPFHSVHTYSRGQQERSWPGPQTWDTAG